MHRSVTRSAVGGTGLPKGASNFQHFQGRCSKPGALPVQYIAWLVLPSLALPEGCPGLHGLRDPTMDKSGPLHHFPTPFPRTAFRTTDPCWPMAIYPSPHFLKVPAAPRKIHGTSSQGVRLQWPVRDRAAMPKEEPVWSPRPLESPAGCAVAAPASC